jgi:hypothetical protein
VQDEIVQQLVTTLRVEVQEAEQERVRCIPTENLTADDSFLRGVEHYERLTNICRCLCWSPQRATP